jgi:DNA excision repair protein ERCC-2
MTELKLSVTDLVEFGARSGDLYYERPAGPSALEGILGHQRIQKARGPQWQSEYLLKHYFEIKDYKIHLQGRADLLDATSSPCIVEEIKTTLTSAEHIPANKLALYWAQTRVYACLYGLISGNQALIHIRISLLNLTTQELNSETRPAAFTELLQETETLLKLYADWHRQISARREAMRTSARALNFPYTNYRTGQYAFAGNVYRAIREGQTLITEAPTGIGKTISTLFPACKALGEQLADQILYLTAKTSGQAQAEDTLSLLRDKGLHIDSLTLCAKDKLCPCRAGDNIERAAMLDDAGVCRYTRGFYDRLPAARQACLAEPTLDQSALTRIGAAYQVCPFALGLQMVTWTTVIIGDYNYFFDPLTSLHVFTEGSPKLVLLMDELHNLPERSAAMFSATLSSTQLADLAEQYGGAIAKKCRKVNRTLSALIADKPLCEELPSSLAQQIGDLMELLAITQSSTENIPKQNEIAITGELDNSEPQRELYRFFIVSQLFGAGHRLVLKPLAAKSGGVVALLRCIDPAPLLQQSLADAHASVGFSATLTPLDFYIRVLGLPSNSKTQLLGYPFPSENLLVLRCDYLDTRWQQRESSLPALLELLAGVIRARPGKYLVFFPSYEYLQRAHLSFRQHFPNHTTVVQQAGADRLAQEDFLSQFFHSEECVLGFAILGGIFAEGIDYRADALHGAIIVGTGMPQPTDEKQLMVQHFAKAGLNGFQYAYQIPGFTRVLQTAGRVIRSETDKGVVVLVDPRFARPDFNRLMPPHWQPVGCNSLAIAQHHLHRFWEAI